MTNVWSPVPKRGGNTSFTHSSHYALISSPLCPKAGLQAFFPFFHLQPSPYQGQVYTINISKFSPTFYFHVFPFVKIEFKAYVNINKALCAFPECFMPPPLRLCHQLPRLTFSIQFLPPTTLYVCFKACLSFCL